MARLLHTGMVRDTTYSSGKSIEEGSRSGGNVWIPLNPSFSQHSFPNRSSIALIIALIDQVCTCRACGLHTLYVHLQADYLNYKQTDLQGVASIEEQ